MSDETHAKDQRWGLREWFLDDTMDIDEICDELRSRENEHWNRAGCRIRHAWDEDAPRIVACVTESIRELHSNPDLMAPPGALETCRSLIRARESLVIVGHPEDNRRGLMGVLTAIIQPAMGTPSRHAAIQDIWVEPAYRSKRVGGAILAAVVEHCAGVGIPTVEVRLQTEPFAGFAAPSASSRRKVSSQPGESGDSGQPFSKSYPSSSSSSTLASSSSMPKA